MAVPNTLIQVAVLNDLQDGIGHVVVAGGSEIALFRQGAEVTAIDARCPHAGGALADGMVCGEVVICPLHLRRVNLRTGNVDDWPSSLRCYPVTIAGDRVLIDLA